MVTRRSRHSNGSLRSERVSRARMHLLALATLTVVGIYLCYRIVEPFLPALAWAVALAVISYPAHSWIRKYVRSDSWAAAISTILVVAVILVPSLLAAAQLAREAGQFGQVLKDQAETGKWRDIALRFPHGDQFVPWVEANYDFGSTTQQVASFITREAGKLFEGSVWAALQVLVTVFVLYYCFRDHQRLLRGVRAMVPLPPAETEETFRRMNDSIHATVYATIVCSLVQGITGGLLFWSLGLPAPVMWGAVMFILGVIPFLGAFLVWLPAALLLVAQDRYWAAAALVAWGLSMAGPVLNYLYAYLAGGRMRMHPVPALIAFIGGLAVFGVTGMILGPAIVVVTMELINAWRRRAVPVRSAGQASKLPLASAPDPVPSTV